MLTPFLAVGMNAPARQIAFRRTVTGHVLLVSLLCYLLAHSAEPGFAGAIAQLLLIMGIVEGAALIGWRLTQLPKSQALEFFLVSPLRPHQFFLGEAIVGIGRFVLVCLSACPVLVISILHGLFEWQDLWVILGMPMLWGCFTGIALTAWVYEPVPVRRIGEILGLLGVMVYLVIGVMAAENLRLWLESLPPTLGKAIYDTVLFLHNGNPFGVVRYWFASDCVEWVAWERFNQLNVFGLVCLVAFFLRASYRLKGHFQDRHYPPRTERPASSRQGEFLAFSHKLFPFSFTGRPLSWWAIRRVMEYSGRVNLWLALGFSLIYALYLIAGDRWPAWMGRLVFQLFESWGGAPMVSTALVVMAAVPAAYQFGLWDPTKQDRCKRLELLLLTELEGADYAHAAFAAAWKRGRGYLVGAAFLWAALALNGRIAWWDAIAASAGAGAFWMFAFATGYRGFATGHQTNGTASLITLGLPLMLWLLWQAGWTGLASLLPTACMFVPLRTGVTWPWAIGFLLTMGYAGWQLRRTLHSCDQNLRHWYDINQGTKMLT